MRYLLQTIASLNYWERVVLATAVATIGVMIFGKKNRPERAAERRSFSSLLPPPSVQLFGEDGNSRIVNFFAPGA